MLIEEPLVKPCKIKVQSDGQYKCVEHNDYNIRMRQIRGYSLGILFTCETFQTELNKSLERTKFNKAMSEMNQTIAEYCPSCGLQMKALGDSYVDPYYYCSNCRKDYPRKV